MTPSRWKQVEELYHAALECEPGQRAALLERVDPKLRGEVESLLAQESGATPLDHPAWKGAASLLGSTVAALTPGTQLGPYKIEGPLGSGGMGEVFRATDTRLGRAVAIKTSAAQFSSRFDREARAISSLNHPHICTLHDVGPNYLVMELCEGETLAARLKRGKLSIQESLRYGAQIADALAAAHAKGITHRDLKPGNIMLGKSGVKVLDFGLAKSPQDETLTGTRMVIGTPAYMAPEQREGNECDSRTDIYALGLILHEMATGRRAEPEQKDHLPEKLTHVIQRCLEQDPAERWQTASDVRKELQWAATSTAIPNGTAEPSIARRSWLAWAVAALLAAATAVALWAPWRKAPTTPETVQFQVRPQEKPTSTAFLQISPDGRYIVFVGGTEDHDRLWLRSLDSLDEHILSGTDNATNPFWSADSRFIAFSAEGQLKKIPIAGGPPQIICDLPENTAGGDWNRDDVILIGNQYGALSRVSATGGPRTAVTALDKARQETFHGRPVFLPDGKHFLYVRASIDLEAQGIYLGSLEVKPDLQSRQRLLPGSLGVGYAPGPDSVSGYVLFLQGDTLMARKFDNDRLQFTGEPAPVAEHVGSNRLSTSYFSVSKNGALIYRTVNQSRRQLRWFDRQGKALSTFGEPGVYRELALSPDGTRVALGRYDITGHDDDLWVLDSTRGTSTRLTFNPGQTVREAWSANGNEVFFSITRQGRNAELYRKSANGAGQEALVLQAPVGTAIAPTDVSSDGKNLLYTESTPISSDIFVLPLDGRGKPVPFVATRAYETNAKFSPDGRWVAYQSGESGRMEIYVRPFPPTAEDGGKWMLSNSGGLQPRWRRDGKEIFYLAPSGAWTAVEVSTGAAFKAGTPKVLFARSLGGLVLNTSSWLWDVSPDGFFFIDTAPTETGGADNSDIYVVLNWTGLLNR